ncbi:putative SAM dependent methyltransferase [Encephalitozoon hellem ATCC 50504]|nr:putative SAM dependent methyltransferase [Encephalitozoon hellem ATCC 50504]AFM98314.1 putative SAM dependent methyltransferase [Encephalitozoon hellem ATCC 50504]UTX43193.1 putative rRNA (guanine-N(7))-methyltransferase [Encephalitozoon hellem]|eukprot:XP_003887295.1 putative SAM dependent methyltransferase [Encephalitozoon hellem ATCC 50504]
MGIPELSGPAELYYDEETSAKYTQNSRIVYIQRELTERCLELLEAKDGGLLLDIGCGSGLSGSVLTENGYPWVGIDISTEMLRLGIEKGEGLGYIRMDMGRGLVFQPGTFDGVVSVSAIQWLFHSYSSDEHPIRRIRTFFTTLYSVCKPDAKCVLQFYLKNQSQVEMLKNEAIRAGFDGGIQVDNEGTRNVKSFLVLTSGKGTGRKRERKKKRKGRIDEILKRKEKLRLRGVEVPRDTKYTGRRRSRR